MSAIRPLPQSTSLAGPFNIRTEELCTLRPLWVPGGTNLC